MISESAFELNKATSEGGAIRYNRETPIFKDNTFTQNKAKYGSDIASYPIRFQLNE